MTFLHSKCRGTARWPYKLDTMLVLCLLLIFTPFKGLLLLKTLKYFHAFLMWQLAAPIQISYPAIWQPLSQTPSKLSECDLYHTTTSCLVMWNLSSVVCIRKKKPHPKNTPLKPNFKLNESWNWKPKQWPERLKKLQRTADLHNDSTSQRLGTYSLQGHKRKQKV